MATAQELTDAFNTLLAGYAAGGGIIRSATPDLQIEKLRPSELRALRDLIDVQAAAENYSDVSPINIGVYSSGGGGCRFRNV